MGVKLGIGHRVRTADRVGDSGSVWRPRVNGCSVSYLPCSGSVTWLGGAGKRRVEARTGELAYPVSVGRVFSRRSSYGLRPRILSRRRGADDQSHASVIASTADTLGAWKKRPRMSTS